MSDFRSRIEEFLASADHESRKHVHPRLLKMFELAGMDAHFTRAEGPHLWDDQGERYLDLLAGGGVHFLGRNHPRIHEALMDVLSMNLPNLCVTNPSALGGLVAGRLLEMAGGRLDKVVFANSGSEANEVALRFARQATRRRRYLYLEGAFHGRSYGAISVCGFKEMRVGLDPAMPTCTPIKAHDLAQLKRELRPGDVAALIIEPIQGMTGMALEAGYLREAENLCNEYGTLLIADEVQTGLGRTGAWFATDDLGVRPHMITVSKALSGGAVPVAAVLVDDSIYDRIYSGFGTGLVYFSTFAENNLAMAAALATLEALEELDATERAQTLGDQLEDGLLDLQQRFDCIDELRGRGLMRTVTFRDSSNPALFVQQKAMAMADTSAFAAAVHVDLYRRNRVITQIPGPGVNAIKVLPPVVCTDEDIAYFLGSFEDTLEQFEQAQTGPVARLGRGILASAAKKVGEFVPAAAPPLLQALGEKKTTPDVS